LRLCGENISFSIAKSGQKKTTSPCKGPVALFCLYLIFWLAAVLAVEALHSTRGVHYLLFSREEGVARGADIEFGGPLFRGFGLDHVSARALKPCWPVFGMYFFFHFTTLTLLDNTRNPGNCNLLIH
jgi:hypothetical protein